MTQEPSTHHKEKEELVLVKMSILPKATYRFNSVPTKIPVAFFTEIGKKIIKFVWSQKKIPNRQSNPEKEKQS